jgi:polar amino acid transport system substrate-binding protein
MLPPRALLLAAILVAPALLMPPEAIGQPLRVGTKEAPPFSIKAPDGTWEGVSIELWESLADSMGMEYELVEMDLDELLLGLEDKTLDAAVAALTVTGAREERFDFTHPFFIGGLGIAVSSSQQSSWLPMVRALFSFQFLQVILVLGLVLLIVGTLVWFFERRKNPEEFGGSVAEGLWSGFWWSAVTMTTVGYGDKSPATHMGRVVGLFWMFTGIIIISSFTAAITSVLTVAQLDDFVNGPEDLQRARVGTVDASTSEKYLQGHRIGHASFGTVEEALDALEDGHLDAVVYDAPILRYLVTLRGTAGLRVLSEEFETQYYGVGLPSGSRYRDQINRLLLSRIESDEWKSTVFRYLGQ